MLRAFLERFQLGGGEFILGAFNGGKQEIAVIRAVFYHWRIFVSRQKHFLPQAGIAGQNVVFLLHELGKQRCCFIGAAGLRCHERRNIGIAARCAALGTFVCLAGRKADCQGGRYEHRYNLR